ncbi:MAG TPA: type I polyketide synthase [Bryobacteraceae bacterium]|jgi:acyl transferase domain-containing protein
MSEGIAIIGMSGRFPGARNVDDYWANIRDGRESIRSISDGELLAAGVPEATLRDPLYIKSGAVLDNPCGFDARFFGYTPREATLIDPQHRLMLECCWDALENAGYAGADRPEATGVFAGSSMNTYLIHSGLSARFFDDWVMMLASSDKDFLATRVAFKCDLRGPALTIQTACSTSLTAIHYACQSLLWGEVDMALAGGVCVKFPHVAGYGWRDGGMFSRDGHCRPFDACASGTIFGSGAGIVVLKRLDDALRDRDSIHAVILGSAVNNDGATKGTYTAPSVERQSAVVREALANAAVAPDSISLFEAHGTGTPIGDPIEVAAATQAFRQQTDRVGYCALGSVKANIGHVEAAAGVAGLIKAAIALRERTLPPSLHFERPNPALQIDDSPFYVNTKPLAWDSDGRTPRRAAVNALGVGGTNVHVILEEPPRPVPAPVHAGQSCYLLPISAKDPTALIAMREALIGFLEGPNTPELHDIAATLQAGRKHFACRSYVVAANKQDAAAKLRGLASGGEETCEVAAQGRQWSLGATDTLKPLGEAWRRVPLPTYPFRSQPYCWKG